MKANHPAIQPCPFNSNGGVTKKLVRPTWGLAWPINQGTCDPSATQQRQAGLTRPSKRQPRMPRESSEKPKPGTTERAASLLLGGSHSPSHCPSPAAPLPDQTTRLSPAPRPYRVSQPRPLHLCFSPDSPHSPLPLLPQAPPPTPEPLPRTRVLVPAPGTRDRPSPTPRAKAPDPRPRRPHLRPFPVATPPPTLSFAPPGPEPAMAPPLEPRSHPRAEAPPRPLRPGVPPPAPAAARARGPASPRRAPPRPPRPASRSSHRLSHRRSPGWSP